MWVVLGAACVLGGLNYQTILTSPCNPKPKVYIKKYRDGANELSLSPPPYHKPHAASLKKLFTQPNINVPSHLQTR